MKYFVSLTDLHSALIEGMRAPGDCVVVLSRRRDMRQKILGASRLVVTALRVMCDRRSHVYVANPFDKSSALLIWLARFSSIFDDGTAYYARPSIPEGLGASLCRWLTRKTVDWEAVDSASAPTWSTILHHSSLQSFSAIFPDRFEGLPIAVDAINLGRAFPPLEPTASPAITLFLDTTEESRPNVSQVALIESLAAAAQSSCDGVLYYRPHPHRASDVSRRLSEVSWARVMPGSLEQVAARVPIARLFSFSSSGAISVKLSQSTTELVNIRARGGRDQPELADLFASLGASELML